MASQQVKNPKLKYCQFSHLQTHIPPAFYDRDGKFYQPPSFEMPVGGNKGQTPERNRKRHNGSSGEPPREEKDAGMRALS